MNTISVGDAPRWCPCCEKQMAVRLDVRSAPNDQGRYEVVTCRRCRIIIAWRALSDEGVVSGRFGPFFLRNFD